MNILPWYKSQVLQAQIVQAVTALLALLGIVTDIDVTAGVAALFVVIQIGAAIWAAFARIKKANPPITETAALAEVEFQKKAGNAEPDFV